MILAVGALNKLIHAGSVESYWVSSYDTLSKIFQA